MLFNYFEGRIFQFSLHCYKSEKQHTEADKESYPQPSFCDLPEAIRQPLSVCQAVLQPAIQLVSSETSFRARNSSQFSMRYFSLGLRGQ